MSTVSVRYEKEDVLGILTIDRPERRNAVDGPTARALLAAYRDFESDDAVKVLVITGAGGAAFCAGADLKEMSNDPAAPEGPMGFTRRVPKKPAIAAIEGWCVAGGLEIALFCDLRICGQGARFGCLERRFGVPLIDGGTQRLPRIVGLGRALDLVLTGRLIDATEAESMGLVNRVVADGDALSAAKEVGRLVASFPWACVMVDRDALLHGVGRPLAEGLRFEAENCLAALTEGAAGAADFSRGSGRHGSAR